MSRKSDITYPPMADPVIGWLCHRHKWKDWQVIGLMMAVAAVIMLGIGSFASQQYSGPGRRISSIDNIAFILAWILMFLPLIWKIYLWQGFVVGELFNNLNKKMIFGRPNTERYKSVKTAAETIHASQSKPWIYFLVFVLLVGFWVYEIGYGWPQQIMVNGPQYWLEVKWYFPLHVFAWALGLYAVFTLAIRQAMIVFGISSVLRDNDVDVNPYDPDEAGDLGAWVTISGLPSYL